jgi:predicted nucleic acid-binding protein
VIGADPTDNRVLECAVAGNAAYIVTGDKHLLDIKEYQGIIMLSPAGFLAFLDS